MSVFESIHVRLSVQLGETRLPIHQVLRMGRGAVIELDAHETDDVKILVDDVVIARGQVVLKGERIGVVVTEVLMRDTTKRQPKVVERLVGEAA